MCSNTTQNALPWAVAAGQRWAALQTEGKGGEIVGGADGNDKLHMSFRRRPLFEKFP